MTSSPNKQAEVQHLGSPRSPGRLRKLQSAHQLSTHYTNGPSLITQQRQQQQRNASISQNPAVPSVPLQYSPKKTSRTRSNSETDTSALPKPVAPPKRLGVSHKIPTFKTDKDELEWKIRHGPQGNLSLARKDLGDLILRGAIDADRDGMSHYRIYIWLILLKASPITTEKYLEMMRRGPSPAHAKISDDTFRTFKTNPLFKRRVTDNSLIRLLNAVAWRLHDAKQGSSDASDNHTKDDDLTVKGSTNGSSTPGIYVQGMNVLCAPFLYVARSEAEALVLFHTLITRECPSYIRGAMDGVHKGVQLVDRCLEIADPILSAFLLSRGLKAEIYAFPSVLTMCASTPTLQEVLRLWDFLLAYGVHLNILCICVQLMRRKHELMNDKSPGSLLRTFPDLVAEDIIGGTVRLIPKIPKDLYQELVTHTK